MFRSVGVIYMSRKLNARGRCNVNALGNKNPQSENIYGCTDNVRVGYIYC
jgi:hypothetical protein